MKKDNHTKNCIESWFSIANKLRTHKLTTLERLLLAQMFDSEVEYLFGQYLNENEMVEDKFYRESSDKLKLLMEEFYGNEYLEPFEEN